jgi:imidazolonepropionase-like amidohydrolase
MWTFDARDQANADLNAPRLAVTGPLIATHPSPELDGSDPPVVVTTSASQSRELVRRVLERRPDLVKILWVYVAGDDDIATQSEIVRAAIEESHARGARAAVHALELQTAKAALRAGADILVHSVEDQPVDAELIELLKARDTIYIPTLAVMEGYYKVFGQDGGPIPMTDIERRFGDPLVIQSWSELLSISLEDVARSPHLPPREERPVMFDNLRVVASNGIRIAVGTDAGNIGTLHGPSIHREMELMAQAGLRPAEILAAATKNAAAVMGRAMELGTIEKGKLADIVILNADPLVDVKHLRDIFRVIKGGAFVEIDENALKEK